MVIESENKFIIGFSLVYENISKNRDFLKEFKGIQ